MRRRTLFGIGALGLVAAGTCSWWTRAPDAPLDLVSLTGQGSRRFVPAQVGTELWAVLRVDVGEGPTEERPPVHVGLVIDTSGSMAGAPIEAARTAAAELVGSLQDGDRLTVVTFDSQARLVVPNVELDDDAPGETRTKDVYLAAKAEDDEAVLAESVDPEVEREIDRAKAAALTLQAVALSRDGKDVDAMQMLEQAAPSARAAAERWGDSRLLDQAEQMSALAGALADDRAESEPESAESEPVERDGKSSGSVGMPSRTKSPRAARALRQSHGSAMESFQARSSVVSRR